MGTPWYRIALLRNPIQEYEWGSRTFFSELLNRPTPSEKPQAELWMGAHPRAPSEVMSGDAWIPLPQLIRENPDAVLGETVAKKYRGRLPFLFKILVAEKPLSIQAHPDLEKAREGYERETGMGIPLDAPHRNYRDRNHKPEIICALTPFLVLKGFRNIGQTRRLVDSLESPLLKAITGDLLDRPPKGGIRPFISSYLTLDSESRKAVTSQAVKGAKKRAQKDPAFEWMLKLHRIFPLDGGILAPLFLNLVRLEPGEALALHNGEPHSYLEGAAIELMANSDNVLRGGLTTKHIDVPELLKVLRFTETRPALLEPQPEDQVERVYPTQAEEFVLSVITPRIGSPYTSGETRAVEIMICVKGRAEITDLATGNTFSLSQGISLLIPASAGQYKIQGEAAIYKATVPST